ncbi:MAG TPA: sugar ABC transporter ATP-binding protein [Dongiaceae bacterium]|jgi:ribose transport system ATP-binding protein|nr:sugar ABC transporter ATP-binding protein [Dongiaceae bacterium]
MNDLRYPMAGAGGVAGRAFVEMAGIGKSYGGVTALKDVDFSIATHSIHAVLGENGAGKSTLIKILAGVVAPDAGTFAFDGSAVAFASPRDAARLGIACVFQELSLVPDLTVADNIFLAHGSPRFGFFSRRVQRQDAERILAELDSEDINPAAAIRNLPLAQAQIVEIAKALVQQPRLLILDEATSALSERHVTRLFEILRGLRDGGRSIVYISHRMHEIESIADACSVFRNGQHVGTFAQGAKSPGDVIEMMIGRSIAQIYPPKRPVGAGAPLLEVRDLHWEHKVTGVSFSVRAGEVYGLGGLEGQGQTETLQALFGVLRRVSGEVSVGGTPVRVRSPRRAKRSDLAIAFVPEDRKTEGLHLHLSVSDNIALSVLGKLTRHGLLDRRREKSLVADMVERLRIRVSTTRAEVSTLSGGNQQKVVLAKWLAIEPRVILLCDPTRGIDVGTKAEIYKLLRELAAEGVAIVFYTTDYDELIGLCDRVGIFYGGRISQELSGAEMTETSIVKASFGLQAGDAREGGR